jgi:hypothetical protein
LWIAEAATPGGGKGRRLEASAAMPSKAPAPVPITAPFTTSLLK